MTTSTIASRELNDDTFAQLDAIIEGAKESNEVDDSTFAKLDAIIGNNFEAAKNITSNRARQTEPKLINRERGFLMAAKTGYQVKYNIYIKSGQTKRNKK
jgi:hypothetical protein